MDENATIEIADYLPHLYPDHEFRTFQHEQLSGTLDTDLFPIVAARGYDVIVTDDKSQMNPRSDEYQALVQSGLHWLGYGRSTVPSIEGVALSLSGFIAGFPSMLRELGLVAGTEVRLAIKLHGMPRERYQRLSSVSELSSTGYVPEQLTNKRSRSRK